MDHKSRLKTSLLLGIIWTATVFVIVWFMNFENLRPNYISDFTVFFWLTLFFLSFIFAMGLATYLGLLYDEYPMTREERSSRCVPKKTTVKGLVVATISYLALISLYIVVEIDVGKISLFFFIGFITSLIFGAYLLAMGITALTRRIKKERMI